MAANFKRKFWINIGIIALSFVIFTFVYFELGSSLEKKADAIASHRADSNKFSNTSEVLASLKKSAPEAERYQQYAHQLLPEQYSLVDFPRWVDGLSKVRRLTLNFSFKSEIVGAQANSAGYIPFVFDVTGGLEDSVLFLRDLEEQAPRYLVSLESIDVTRNNDSFRTMAQGKVYFRK
jgi:hypothetical protein